jgi:hypothetical protein
VSTGRQRQQERPELTQPVTDRLAEILVAHREGPSTRGTGYRVAAEWVLTAEHVVAGAEQIAVWFGAPERLFTKDAVAADPAAIVSAPKADLALLHMPAAPAGATEPTLLGRLDRNARHSVPVTAAGFPRLKLRTGVGPEARTVNELHVRELHEVRGMISANSNRKTRTYELSGLSLVPDEDPERVPHSPWEGMSGAAVWADGRVVGVIAQHHPTEGRGTLTVRPLEELFRCATREELSAWQKALGPVLPTQVRGLWEVTRRDVNEHALDEARRAAQTLSPEVLCDRDAEVDALDDFAASTQQWQWVQGATYAGKTGLLAWFAAHPPPDVSVVSCFLRRTIEANTADYALDKLGDQLAAVADLRDRPPRTHLADRLYELPHLLDAAARVCRERGHRLLLVVDGLDEYDDAAPGPLDDWLPDDGALPSDAALLAASRAHAHVELAPTHPLRDHVWPIVTSEAGKDRARLAKAELRQALIDPGSLEFTSWAYSAPRRPRSQSAICSGCWDSSATASCPCRSTLSCGRRSSRPSMPCPVPTSRFMRLRTTPCLPRHARPSSGCWPYSRTRC